MTQPLRVLHTLPRLTRKQGIGVGLIVMLGLLGSLWLLHTESLTPTQTDEEARPEASAGPHGGVVLGKDQAYQLEVLTKSKASDPLQFVLYVLQKGQPVTLPAQALQASWLRLGHRQPLTLQAKKEALTVQETMEEPQSFALEASLRTQGQTFKYEWEHFENRLSLSAVQLNDNAVAFSTAGPRVLSESLELPGRITLDPLRQAHLSSPLSGIVIQVFKRAGDPVFKGEALALLESQELGTLKGEYRVTQTRLRQARQRYDLEQGFYDASQLLLKALIRGESVESLHQRLLRQPIGLDRQRLMESYSSYRLAQQTYAREQTLLPKQATTRADFQQAEQALVAARATYQASLEDVSRQRQLALLERKQELERLQPDVDLARQKLALLGLSGGDNATRFMLRAPLKGRVLASQVSLRQALSAQSEAFVIADLSEVRAEIQVAESQLEALRLGAPVTVRTQTGSRTYAGLISQTGAILDEATRTTPAQATLANRDGFLRPGMFVTVALPGKQHPAKVAVPVAAIQRLEEQPMVFVRDGEALQAVPVVLGRQAGAWVEIREGLQAGQRYVSGNSFLLKAELGKSSTEED